MMQQYRNLAHVWSPVARDALLEHVRSFAVISLHLSMYVYIYMYVYELTTATYTYSTQPYP